MINRIKELVFGSPLPTFELRGIKLNKIRALAAFSPDALSSIAYANQEIYLALLAAGAVGLSQALPIGLVIVTLLGIVALSYAQVIHGYPSGGGSYMVARENLGMLPGLIAAAALMIDYVLTAAVSLTAGVDAIASAFPVLLPYRVFLALGILVLLTMANIRGLKETGTLMSLPVYLFLGTFLAMLVYGLYHLLKVGPINLAATAPLPSMALSTILVLHAFAAGCTALTGIEAISDGVPAFKPPEIKNAQKTLLVMAVLMAVLFVGSIGLTQFFAIIARPNETILSGLARYLLGSGPAYVLVQFTTMAILAVAANTSFAGFPRVAAILAGDRFLPRQLTNLGDRLVYANGILILSGVTAILIVVFKGNSHALVPLFAIGAFLAFTLSQTGMVVHWLRSRERGWLIKALVNGIGAAVTLTALVIIVISKFIQGAWISVLMIPLIMVSFLQIRNHYQRVAQQLSLHGLPPSLKPPLPPRVVIPISGIHRGIVDAVNFARSMSAHITALYIELDPGSHERISEDWAKWWPDIPLVVVPSPYRSIIEPLFNFLDQTDIEHNDGQQAVLIMPEFVPAKWWQIFLHNQSAWLIRMALLYRRRNKGYQRVIIDIPYHLRK